MTVRWTPTGLRDLESLYAYVAQDSRHASEEAAAKIVERILAGLEAVGRFLQWAAKGAWRARGSSSFPPSSSLTA